MINLFLKLHPITLCLISFTASAQSPDSPSDLKELGFSGKVKTVTVFSYSADHFTKDSSRWKVTDKEAFTSKKTWYFNKRGNVDSVVTVTPYEYNGKTTLYYSYVYWEFDAAGNKKGYKFYNSERKLEQVAEVKWIDTFHYVQTNYSFTKENVKQKEQEVWFTLNYQGRELCYEIKSFKPWNGVVKEQFFVLNTLKEGRYVEKKRVEYQIDKGFDEVLYEYPKKDSYGNPLETVKLQTLTKRPLTMEIAQYEFYN